jgi:hypothetical protein
VLQRRSQQVSFINLNLSTRLVELVEIWYAGQVS